ncbi:MAG TPA: hypothetical protein VFV68_12605 [Agriterribacter sp.]|nr:hypothetical protein [Agriterribacter sp.]
MKAFYTILSSLLLSMVFSAAATAQNEWPKTINTTDGQLIKVYQWQPESFSNGTLQANAAVSVTEKGNDEPAFGMIWLTADASEKGQQVSINSVDVDALKLPNESDADKLARLQTTIANGMSNWNLAIPSSEITDGLQARQQQEKLSGKINNNAPKIMYSDKPSLLVVIDGAPKLQKNSSWGVETVMNTPFIIIKNNNNKYYLYGGKHWYIAPAATGPYSITTNVPSNLEKIETEIIQANKDNSVQQEENDYTISNIIVSTEPAELIQSNGEPNFTPVEQTNLLYIKNSGNDIFMDVSSQQYYVLLSGRWYKSTALSGKWNYVASDKLPADFAAIPEGSPKDNVLASVAGTVAAKDAVMDAQVPQTAKVDRKKAKADIQYDGNPRFDDIEGTDMAYAVNTPDYVIRWRGSYYAVDNGVWFQSYSADGPWMVSTSRPYAVSLIPPRYPVYSMKYVYIYDATPDYIYMGYTPGYLNTFVYGPTVVYGTGYYYRPWYGHYYYARPYTWGFNMHYNPWTGWGFGFNYNMGWFNMGWGGYNSWGWYGWWGPSIYRPSYCWAPYYGGYKGGYYGHAYHGGNTYIVNNINVYRNNNIYHSRTDVISRDNRRAVSYNRNARPASARTFNNPRPSERTAGRNINSSARPSVGTASNSGNTSPRNQQGRVSGNSSTTNNPNASMPSRSFTGRPTSSGNNNPANTERPSGRTGSNPDNNSAISRQLAERRPSPLRENINNRPSSTTRSARESATSQPAQQQQPVRSQRNFSNTSTERQQPTRRNTEIRTSAPVQRAERSNNNQTSINAESSRSAGSSKNRSGR